MVLTYNTIRELRRNEEEFKRRGLAYVTELESYIVYEEGIGKDDLAFVNKGGRVISGDTADDFLQRFRRSQE